jgi:tetratricopeptide (TPR) repeat protein/O-antigen ligase
MVSKLTRWCDGFLEAAWLAAIIATPLFFNIHSSRVFEPDKLTLLRSLALLMALVWIIRFIDRQEWQQWRRYSFKDGASIWRLPFVAPVALLVVVYLVSTLFSVTPSASWAGSYQRLQGTYTTLSYVVIFALMAATIRSRSQVDRIVTAVIITSIPIALYAMLQRFGHDPLPWGGDTQERVAGHMGNAIFVAAYLIMAVPLTLARIIDAFTNILGDEELSYADVARSSIYVFSLAIQLLTIYWTFSRGPWLGLGVGLFAFVLIMLVSLRNTAADQRRLRLKDGLQAFGVVLLGVAVPLLIVATLMQPEANPLRSLIVFTILVGLVMGVVFMVDMVRRGWLWLWLDWISLALLLALLLGLFNVPDQRMAPYRQVPVAGEVIGALSAWREAPGVGRLGRLLEADTGTGRVRVLIWEGALQLILPHEPIVFPDGSQDRFNFLRPLIGYGPESMYVAYNRFYPPELATLEARNASPDRSHNETFDALVITGLLGFVIWQLLYLSVFYYGFRWLGVVRSARERNVLFGSWFGGALLAAILLTFIYGPAYLGVAIPFGSIGGLVFYLIYYALFARPDMEAARKNPFGAEHLLLVALVAAVAAHYVEIHFGIAIAATRLHFFAYVALLLVVGHLLPRLAVEPEAAAVAVAAGRKRRPARAPVVAQPGWLAQVVVMAAMLALITGILGYQTMTYSLPPGQLIQRLADVPRADQIFQQALFVNPREGFADSPYLYSLIVFSWALGLLLGLSEMAKAGLLSATAVAGSRLPSARSRATIFIFALFVVAGLALRYIGIVSLESTLSREFGGGLLLIWAAFCLLAAIRLVQGRESARFSGAAVATLGLIAALPTMAAGGLALTYGLLMLVGCTAVLYFLWDDAWSQIFAPALMMAYISLPLGLLFTYFQAWQIRFSIIGPQGLQADISEAQRRVLETDIAAGFLTFFYFFVLVILVMAAIALAQTGQRRWRKTDSAPAYVALMLLLPLGFYLVSSTNMRIVQADIVYKRADPWDRQAMQTRNPADWDNAITIYERAISLAPREDFYYLWLGRAYLEKSSLVTDLNEQTALLATAESRLREAQAINPLNTDHTANLARLNTRWAELSNGLQRELRTETASGYYQDALSLSPRNAVVWNEYARLIFVLLGDCDGALSVLERSGAADPYFADTYFTRAEIATSCAQQAAEGEQQSYHDMAVASLEGGLWRNPHDTRRWLQATEIYLKRLDDPERALAVYEEVRNQATTDFPLWQIDLTVAQWFSEMGDREQAHTLARRALAVAPPEMTEQIQAFLDQLAGEG